MVEKNGIKIYKLHPILLELIDGKWTGGTNLWSTGCEALIEPKLEQVEHYTLFVSFWLIKFPRRRLRASHL